MEESKFDVTKDLTLRFTAKITYVDEQLLAKIGREARDDRAKQLRRLRQLLSLRTRGDQVAERPPSYRVFRREYVTKLRWLHSGKWYAFVGLNRVLPPSDGPYDVIGKQDLKGQYREVRQHAYWISRKEIFVTPDGASGIDGVIWWAHPANGL